MHARAGIIQVQCAQKERAAEVGVMKKRAYTLQGHTNIGGIPVSIENRKGSVRKGTNTDGTEWKTKFKNPYGYITGTTGADGDGVDAYVGPDKSSPNAFVVHQHKDDGKGYDEDKVMLGFKTKAEARKAFLDHYDDKKFPGPVKTVPVERLREMIKQKKTLTKISGSNDAGTVKSAAFWHALAGPVGHVAVNAAGRAAHHGSNLAEMMAHKGFQHGAGGAAIAPLALRSMKAIAGPEATATYDMARRAGKAAYGMPADQRAKMLQAVATGTSHPAMKHMMKSPLFGDIAKAVKHDVAGTAPVSQAKGWMARGYSALVRGLGRPTISKFDAPGRKIVQNAVGAAPMAAMTAADPIGSAAHFGTNTTRELLAKSRVGKAVMDKNVKRGLEGRTISPFAQKAIDIGASPAFLDPYRLGMAAHKSGVGDQLRKSLGDMPVTALPGVMGAAAQQAKAMPAQMAQQFSGLIPSFGATVRARAGSTGATRLLQKTASDETIRSMGGGQGLMKISEQVFYHDTHPRSCQSIPPGYMKTAGPMTRALQNKIATGDMIEYFNQNPKKYEEWKAHRAGARKKDRTGPRALLGKRDGPPGERLRVGGPRNSEVGRAKVSSFETSEAAARARALNVPADATIRRGNAARAAAAPDFAKQYPDVMKSLRSSPLGAHMDDSALQQNFLNTHQQMGNKTYGQTARRLGMGPKQQDMDAMMAQLSAPAQSGGAATVAPAARPVSGVRTVAPRPAAATVAPRPAARTMAPAQRPANTGGPRPVAPAAARPSAAPTIAPAPRPAAGVPTRMPAPKPMTPKAKGFGSALKRVGRKTIGFLSKVASVDTYVGKSEDMDRGMFAERDFEPGEIIEVAPVLVVPRSQVGTGDVLRDYVFNFDKKNVMVALGYASMFNHSYEPNARYKKNKAARTLTFTAIKPIKEGEEIFVNYNLDPKKKDPLWFDVKEKQTEKTGAMCRALEEMV